MLVISKKQKILYGKKKKGIKTHTAGAIEHLSLSFLVAKSKRDDGLKEWKTFCLESYFLVLSDLDQYLRNFKEVNRLCLQWWDPWKCRDIV